MGEGAGLSDEAGFVHLRVMTLWSFLKQFLSRILFYTNGLINFDYNWRV